MVRKLPKIVSLLQIFADVGKQCMAVIAIYVYVSGNSCFALLEYGIGYHANDIGYHANDIGYHANGIGYRAAGIGYHANGIGYHAVTYSLEDIGA